MWDTSWKNIKYISPSNFLFWPNELFTLLSIVSSRDRNLKFQSKNQVYLVLLPHELLFHY